MASTLSLALPPYYHYPAHWSTAPKGCGESTTTDWYLFTGFPAHIRHSSGRVSVYLLQGHLRPSSSLSSPCALLLRNDVMSRFSWLVLRHTIFCPNETVPLALSRDPNLSSLLVALKGRWEDKECDQHQNRFYSRIIVIITYRFQEKIGLENMLFYISTRKFCIVNFTWPENDLLTCPCICFILLCKTLYKFSLKQSTVFMGMLHISGGLSAQGFIKLKLWCWLRVSLCRNLSGERSTSKLP